MRLLSALLAVPLLSTVSVSLPLWGLVCEELISRVYISTLTVMRSDVSWKSCRRIQRSRVGCFQALSTACIGADIGVGHYRALLWKEDTKAWTVDQALGIHVSVEVSNEGCDLHALTFASRSDIVLWEGTDGACRKCQRATK